MLVLLWQRTGWLGIVGIILGVMLANSSDLQAKRRTHYVWEDLSDGFFSLNATALALDAQDSKRLYAAVDGVLYFSKDSGFTWTPLVRFSGGSRHDSQQTELSQRLRQLKDRILEEKLEDLAAEIGEERAEESREVLEREAEEEAEAKMKELLKQQMTSSSNSRFRRYIYRIVIAPRRPKEILVATDGGAFLSLNRGKNFQLIFNGKGGSEGDIRAARISPLDAKMILLGSQKGLWISRDLGQLWYRAGGRLRNAEIREIRFDPLNPKRIFVITPRSLFVSTDNARSFREVFTLVSSGPQKITSLAILATTPKSTIYLGTGNGLYRSRDLRQFTQVRASGLGLKAILYLTSVVGAKNNLYLINARGIFLSRNRGRSFKALRAGLPTQVVRFIAVAPNNPMQIWAATDFGVLRWSPLIGGRITAMQWKKFRRKLSRSRTAWQVAQAVLKYMHLDNALKSQQDRYRYKGLLPYVQIKGYLFIDRNQDNLLLKRVIPDDVMERRTFYIELRAIWSLGQLFWARTEANFVAQLRILRNLRNKLITRVIRLYYARRRLQLRLLTRPPRSLERYMRKLLKIQELTAYLDGMSGGYLTRK